MLQDFRYALRMLRQNPGFALVAIISLALGIGANAAMFSFADLLVLRPLQVPGGSELVLVQSQLRGETIANLAAYYPVSYPDYKDLRDSNRSFSELSAARFVQVGLTAQQGVLPQMEFGELVSGNYFGVMRVNPVMGRTFGPDEDRVRGRDAVVVLGYDLWKNRLSADPDVIGRSIYLNGIPFKVIGVTPEWFLGSNKVIRSALYLPIAMEPSLAAEGQKSTLDKREIRSMTVRGRLNPGVSLAQAVAEAKVVSERLARAYPDSNRTATFTVFSNLQAGLTSSPYNTVLVAFLMALSAGVLLIACANVMNLMVSRARARSREIAVRLAVGAGRARLIRQLLTESLVIAILGGAAGLIVAEAGVDLFSQIRFPSALPIVIDFRLDSRVLLFSLFTAMASAVLFGLMPALKSTSPDLVSALKTGRAEGGKRRRFLGRNALVIAQVAVSLVLMVFATQAYRGAAILLASPVGFRTDHILIANFDPTLARYTDSQTQEFYTKLLDQVRRLNGVKSASLANDVPFGANGDASRVAPEGAQLPAGSEAALVLSSTVTDGYFDAMGIPIVEGRAIEKTDRADSLRVAVVNEHFARHYYPKQSAVGKRFRLNGRTGAMVEIVGVAKQSKYAFVVEPKIEYLYLPLAQHPIPGGGMALLIETTGPPADMAAPLRTLVRSLDAGMPVFGVLTMEDYFDQRARRLVNVLLEVMLGMGLLGLALALIGLYGLMTYSVGLRQREIGIRMAVGADQSSVLRMVLRQGMRLAVTGVVIGLLLSLLAGKPTNAVIGSAGFNLPLLALVALALIGMAALGAYIPARRASRLDPNSVLRQE